MSTVTASPVTTPLLSAAERVVLTRYTFTAGQAGRLRNFAAGASAAGDSAGAALLTAESENLAGQARSLFQNEVSVVIAAHAAAIQVAYEAVLAGTLAPELKVLLATATLGPVVDGVSAAGGDLPEAVATAAAADDFFDDALAALAAAATWVADHAEQLLDLIGLIGSLF